MVLSAQEAEQERTAQRFEDLLTGPDGAGPDV
jgi:hypothetical protein